MTTKRKSQRWGTEKKWFSSSEAARYLGVSVDTIRQLDESGELRASRTKGGHRRFSRKALDAYLVRKTRRGSKQANERPNPRSRPVARPEPDPEPLDDDTDDFEPGDEELEPSLEEPPPPPPPLNPLEKLAREREERRKHEKDEAPLRRLTTLKQYGLNQIGWGIPDSWHARVAAALESYVTLKTFPAWVTDVDAYRIVRGKVEEVLQPYHDEVARKKAEETRREEEAANKRRQEEEEAQEERRVQELINDGMRHARSETMFDWESDDRDRALRDVERMLKDSVESDWTEHEVKDAVNDELDEWEDDDPEADEEVES
jgi:excisionase family DNA binding protein